MAPEEALDRKFHEQTQQEDPEARRHEASSEEKMGAALDENGTQPAGAPSASSPPEAADMDSDIADLEKTKTGPPSAGQSVRAQLTAQHSKQQQQTGTPFQP